MAKKNQNSTRDIPLEMAKRLSQIVNNEWISGEILNKVTPITADLLNYWFSESFIAERNKNFHLGQRQAILNTVYCHEVLKIGNVVDIYAAVSEMSENSFVSNDFLSQFSQSKNTYPKYCVKLATGTGKTWVLDALLIWQFLNSKYTSSEAIKFTRNFLLVAPGLIVYERLLDAFKGKISENRLRDFNTCDLKQNEELFIPAQYRQAVYSFVQNSVLEKTEIGKKITGEGMIAITNWHLLAEAEENEYTENQIETANFSFDQTKELMADLLPLTPGVSAGNALDTLDARSSRGGELDFLANLPDICVFNDEAHHIHEIKTSTDTSEVEWQKALNKISMGKGRKFVQIDFSATPYNTQGSGTTKEKHYFPHIVVDFDLTTAMHAGLVKSFVLDKRKEVAALSNDELEFKAIRNERGKVISLSEGQRIMLRAGLSKLKILEENFKADHKWPKMLVVCEDTTVSPLVTDFLKLEGLSETDVMQIDSDRKGSIPTSEWGAITQKLFNIDKYEQPRVIVSVLMLREGFDVSNVCVIVPLRSSQAPILLEQVLGRGLRLMWREPEYADIKTQNRDNLYKKKISPASMHDLLYVVEHPAFERFYEDLDDSIIAFDDRETFTSQSILGDMISAELKENYKDYDMFIPFIIKDKEETLNDSELSINNLSDYSIYNLEQLNKLVPKDDAERFISEEPKIKTQFGEYKVKGDIFTANSYNEYLQRMLNIITVNIGSYNKKLPLMQVNQTALVRVIDKFIRTRLFGQIFDPLQDNNWRLLMVAKTGIVEHIMKELSKTIYEMQNNVDMEEAIISKRWLSEVQTLKIRENFSLNIVKSIYTKTGYPSNKGGYEKDFLEYADCDSSVERLIKISETRHPFARLHYVRTDGMLASYYPDFMIKTIDKVFVVETKSEQQMSNYNVQAKRQSAIEWTAKINELKAEDRMNAEWRYVLLSDTTFYTMKNHNAVISEILESYILTQRRMNGELEF